MAERIVVGKKNKLERIPLSPSKKIPFKEKKQSSRTVLELVNRSREKRAKGIFLTKVQVTDNKENIILSNSFSVLEQFLNRLKQKFYPQGMFTRS